MNIYLFYVKHYPYQIIHFTKLKFVISFILFYDIIVILLFYFNTIHLFFFFNCWYFELLKSNCFSIYPENITISRFLKLSNTDYCFILYYILITTVS